MAASQNQGFEIEDLVVASRYPGAPKTAYTAEYDVPPGYSLASPHPSQIKSCTGAVEAKVRVMFGDAMRNFDRSIDFETFVSDWTQSAQRKLLRKCVHIVWKKATWRKLFGTAKRKDIAAFVERIKAVPRERDMAEVRSIHEDLRAYCSHHRMIVRLEAKISSKDSQRRLQMSCLLDHLVAIALTDKSMATLSLGRVDCAGLGMPVSIASPPRVRHARKPTPVAAPA